MPNTFYVFAILDFLTKKIVKNSATRHKTVSNFLVGEKTVQTVWCESYYSKNSQDGTGAGLVET
jgi:hypothetical protein